MEYAAANGWQPRSQRVYFEHQYLLAFVEYQAGWRRGSYISPHCEKCEEMRECCGCKAPEGKRKHEMVNEV